MLEASLLLKGKGGKNVSSMSPPLCCMLHGLHVCLIDRLDAAVVITIAAIVVVPHRSGAESRLL